MKAKKRFSWLVAVAICLVLQSCAKWNLWQRQKQIDSFSRVNTIAKLLEKKRTESGGRLASRDVDAILMSVGGGVDAWGHKIRVLGQLGDDTGEVVVVSPGRDGRFDLSQPAAYQALARVDIRGRFDRDIVFRGGLCVTNAGKGPHSDFAPSR